MEYFNRRYKYKIVKLQGFSKNPMIRLKGKLLKTLKILKRSIKQIYYTNIFRKGV